MFMARIGEGLPRLFDRPFLVPHRSVHMRDAGYGVVFLATRTVNGEYYR
jgi:hypothetical protein